MKILKEGMKFPEITLPMLNCNTGEFHPNFTPSTNCVWIIQPGPGYAADPDWMQTCGAAGCTPGVKVFVNARDEFAGTGPQVFFVNSKSTEAQKKATQFSGWPYKFLSDENLKLKELFDLPTFIYKGKEYYYRQAIIVKDGIVDKIFTANTAVKDQESVAESVRHSEEVWQYAIQCFLRNDKVMEPPQKKASFDNEAEPRPGFNL